LGQQKNDRKPRQPKKITPRYLDNVAAYYLGRYASSSANLKRILMRRAHKSCAHHGMALEEAEAMIDDLVAHYRQAGFLNDENYANLLARSLRDKGKSKRQILQKMYEKGVENHLAEKALQAADLAVENGQDNGGDRDAELIAAWRLARRRKLGPFRPAEQRSEYWQKDLGSFARAGFSYDIARGILEQEDVPEDIERGL